MTLNKQYIWLLFASLLIALVATDCATVRADDPNEDPYLDLIFPGAFPDELTQEIIETATGRVHKFKVTLELIKVAGVAGTDRIYHGDTIQLKGTYDFISGSDFDGKLELRAFKRGLSNEIVRENTPEAQYVFHEYEISDPLKPGDTIPPLYTPQFVFDISTDASLLNGKPSISLRSSAEPMWANPQEIEDSNVNVDGLYSCNLAANCPPFPICGDEEVGHTSAFSPPAELAGKHRVTDYRANTSGVGCTSCGTSGGGESMKPSLNISRLMMPSNMDTPSSLSPGMFFSFDYHLAFYECPDPAENTIVLFDPGTGRQMFFDNVDTGDTKIFYEKMMIGTTSEKSTNVFLEIEANTAVLPSTITATRRNGWEYEFEMITVDSLLIGRITKITDTNGKTLEFDYLPGSESDSNHANRVKIDSITDAYGMVAEIEYGTTLIGARYPVSKIDIKESSAGSAIRTINYNYTGDYLTQVTRSDTGNTPVESSSYVYTSNGGTGNDDIKSTESQGQVPRIQTIHLSPNYLATGGAVAVVHANILQGVSDGNDHQYLSVWMSDASSGHYEIAYQGTRIQWSPGQYLRYLQEDLTVEPTYAQHPSTGIGDDYTTAKEILMGRPSEIRTESDSIIRLTYDDNGNVTKREYMIAGVPDSFEEWTYDNFSRETYYSDRETFVTLTDRDPNGRPTKVTQGLKRNGAPPAVMLDSDTDPVETQYGYETQTTLASHGLLTWSATAAYGTTAGEPEKTLFQYDSDGRLEFVKQPIPPGQASRPTTQNTWANGDLTKVTNPLLQDTEYEYDDVGRLVQTKYPDGTTDEYFFDVVGGQAVVDSKNRAGVVSRSTYDDAGRMTKNVVAFATDDNHLTTAPSSMWYAAHAQTPIPSHESPITENEYLDGYTQVFSTKSGGGIRSYFYDYRNRQEIVVTTSSAETCRTETYQYDQNRLQMTTVRLGVLMGDLNMDGSADNLDTALFTDILTGDSDLPEHLQELLADFNGDGVVNLLDNTAFVKTIISGATNPVVSRTYNAYTPDEDHVRIVAMRNALDEEVPPQFTDLNSHLIGLDRSQNSHLVIQDAIRDKRGNIMEVIDGRDVTTRTVHDGMGRLIERIRDVGGIELSSTTEYDNFGNVEITTNESGLKTRNVYSPTATGILHETTVGYLSSNVDAMTTRFEYDALNRRTKVIAPGPDGNPVDENGPDLGRTTVTEYQDACCGQFMATRDPFGNARVSHKDSIGQQIHSSIEENYVYGSTNIGENVTQSETTSRYRPDGRMSFRTSWSVDNNIIIGNTPPPIAGVENADGTTGPAAGNGLTTRYLYDYDLTDGVGLDSSSGESFTRLSGGSGSVSLDAAITKLSDGSGGATITFESDYPGHATAIVSPDEKTVQFSISDGNGRTVMSGYVTGPAAADSGAHTAGDPTGWSVSNVLMDWTITQYDNVVDVSTAGNGSEHNVETLVHDRDLKTTRSRANGLGLVVNSFDQLNNETITVFDEASNPTSVTQKSSTGNNEQEMSYVYDNLGRKTQATDATLNLTTKSIYDPTTGRMQSTEDAKSVANQSSILTSYAYDDLDRPLTVTDRLSNVTTHAYNEGTGSDFENTITDALSNKTTYVLDKLGRRKTIELANGQTTEFTYDSTGRQKELIYKDTNGTVVGRREYVYDSPDFAAGRISGVLKEIRYYQGQSTLIGTDEFTYNAVLQRTFAKQFDGPATGTPDHSIEWKYTLTGQPFQEETTYDIHTLTVENKYDERGRISQVKYPSASYVDYTYTARSEVEDISWNGTLVETRTYTPIGQLTEIERQGFTNAEEHKYTGRRLDFIDTKDVGLGKMTYTFDENFNKTAETWSNNTVLDDYSFNTGGGVGYDAEDRFLQFNRPNLNSGLDETVDFDRSAGSASIGNIIDIDGGVYDGAREFNSIHQLDGPGTTANTQIFDGAGNLTQATSGNTFSWNVAAGRLDSATVVSTPNETHLYGYDATGRRAWKDTHNDPKTLFIYSGPNCIAEIDVSNGQVKNEYVYSGGIDSLTMIVHPDTPSNKRLGVVRNQQWSVVGLIDLDATSNHVVEQYAYNVFGERTVLDGTGSVLTSGSAYGNDYGYTSRRHDAETKLMYFRARFYDPTIGEFISQDPWGVSVEVGEEVFQDGESMYRYYEPISAQDPSGMVKCNGKPNGVVYLSRGKFNLVSLSNFAYGNDWTDNFWWKLGSSFNSIWSSLRRRDWMDSNGCCCCDKVGYVQIVAETVRYVGQSTVLQQGEYKIDGTFPFKGKTHNPCLADTSSLLVGDAPNATFRKFGVILKSLRQDFITCIACVAGNEGVVGGVVKPNFNGGTVSRGDYTGLTVYGCVKWGHLIQFRAHKGSLGRSYLIKRWLKPPGGTNLVTGYVKDIDNQGVDHQTNVIQGPKILEYKGVGANFTGGNKFLDAMNRR